VTTDPPEGLLIVMVETADAMVRAGEIAATPGVDGVLVGTSDLAVSLGLRPGDPLHPRIRDHAVELARVCREQGVVAAIGAQTPEQAAAWLEAGFQMLSLGRDLAAMTERLAEQLAAFRELVDTPPERSSGD
jgi:2-keto-3-deoxy-L-rhamnonate aldolase RhmA